MARRVAGFLRPEPLTPEEASMTESAEFAGRAMAALAAECGFTDVDGTRQSEFWTRRSAGTRGEPHRPS